MSTHAVIGILKDNILDNVYVHSNGDLSWTGRMLLEHYNTAEKANALIQLGDLSIIKERLAPNEGELHGFGYECPVDRAPGVTVAYHRDRNEPLNIEHTKVPDGKLETVFELIDLGIRRRYIFANGQWYFYKAPPYFEGEMAMEVPMPLEEALKVAGLDY